MLYVCIYIYICTYEIYIYILLCYYHAIAVLCYAILYYTMVIHHYNNMISYCIISIPYVHIYIYIYICVQAAAIGAVRSA